MLPKHKLHAQSAAKILRDAFRMFPEMSGNFGGLFVCNLQSSQQPQVAPNHHFAESYLCQGVVQDIGEGLRS